MYLSAQVQRYIASSVLEVYPSRGHSQHTAAADRFEGCHFLPVYTCAHSLVPRPHIVDIHLRTGLVNNLLVCAILAVYLSFTLTQSLPTLCCVCSGSLEGSHRFGIGAYGYEYETKPYCVNSVECAKGRLKNIEPQVPSMWL